MPKQCVRKYLIQVSASEELESLSFLNFTALNFVRTVTSSVPQS
jgi:hypothetical protein